MWRDYSLYIVGGVSILHGAVASAFGDSLRRYSLSCCFVLFLFTVLGFTSLLIRVLPFHIIAVGVNS